MAGFQPIPFGGASTPTIINNPWEAKVWEMLAGTLADQLERTNMSYGSGEPFVNADALTLGGAVIENAYVRNTVVTSLREGTQTWTACGSLPTANGDSMSVLFDGTFVYIIGGYHTTQYTTVYRASIAAIRAGTQTWTAWGSLPTAKGHCMSVFHDGTFVYIIGGQGTTQYTTVYRTTLAALQAGTQVWSPHGALPTTKGHAMSVLYDGLYVYVIGGYDTVNYTEVYRTTLAGLRAGTQTWEGWGVLPTANGVALSVFTDGTFVYVLGGRAASQYTVAYRTTLDALHAGTQVWEAWGTLPTTKGYCLSVLYDGTYVYVIGGNNGTGFTMVGRTSVEVVSGSTIVLDPITVTDATAGKIIFTGYNADAAAPLDVGNAGTNQLEVYPVVDGVPGPAATFTAEELGDNKWRFTSADFSLVGAQTFGVQFQSFARTLVPNFRIYEALFAWRTGAPVIIGTALDNYEAALYANLLMMLNQQAADYGLPNGRLWACADATNLTLTDAVIIGGYAANTCSTAAPGTNLVPTMTSDSAPSGTAAASTVYSAPYAAYRAFNRVQTTSDYWSSLQAGMPQWLRYDFTMATPVAAYTILLVGLALSSHPTAWTLQGSNDSGTTWDTLDVQTGQTFTDGVRRTFTLPVISVAYKAYRLYITGTAATANNVAITEMELLCAPTELYVNPATIIGSSYALTGAQAGRLILRGFNADATAALDIGNSGSNKIEVYQSIDDNTTWSAALDIEEVTSLGSNIYRYVTAEFDMSAATGVGFKVQSLARGGVPNFRLLDVLALWRNS